MNAAAPTYLDFDAVCTDAAPMQRHDDVAPRDGTLENHDDDDAAAEQAEEDQEDDEIVEAARRNRKDL